MKNFLTIILIICLIAALGIAGYYIAKIPSVQGITFADSVYTSVLDDLQKGGDFDASFYPAVSDDYSMQVIQIAESESGELFVYVYQPASLAYELSATSISMSLSKENGNFDVYQLQLVSAQSVFQKYKVNGFVVSDSATRFYNISAIYRKWDSNLDGSADFVKEKAFEVAKCWTAMDYQGDVAYSVEEVQVVEIKHQWAGFLLYNEGYDGRYDFTSQLTRYINERFYVGFSTNYDIAGLFEVELEYTTTPGEYYYSYNRYDKSFFDERDVRHDDQQKSEHTVITADEIDETHPHSYGHHYTWNKISTKDDFIKNNDLTDEAKANLKNDQFVISFLSVQAVAGLLDGGDVSFPKTDYKISYTYLDEVVLLRLKFDAKGTTYNLGVIGDKITSEDKPSNPLEPEFGSNNALEEFLKLVKQWFEDTFGKAWDIIKKVLIAIATFAVAVFIVWVVSKIVEIFKRPKVVIKGDKTKKHKE